MKAKDLINLLFNVEESKEMQESLFYKQYGVISSFLKEYHYNEFKESLTSQLNDKYIQAQTMGYLNENNSQIFLDLIKVLAMENGLNINEIIN